MANKPYPRNFPLPRFSADEKAYSKAVRELLACRDGKYPETWPAKREDWSRAQKLADKHYEFSKTPGPDSGGWARLLIERAEGRVPMAPEDRDAMLEKAGKEADARRDGLRALLDALGMKHTVVQVPDDPNLPALPEGTDAD